MSIKSRFKQLGKDSVIYGIGGIIAKGIGFFLLPVYTRIFSPAEYGTIEMLMVLNQFLGALLVMGMDAAQSFYFFEPLCANDVETRTLENLNKGGKVATP